MKSDFCSNLFSPFNVYFKVYCNLNRGMKSSIQLKLLLPSLKFHFDAERSEITLFESKHSLWLKTFTRGIVQRNKHSRAP